MILGVVLCVAGMITMLIARHHQEARHPRSTHEWPERAFDAGLAALCLGVLAALIDLTTGILAA